MPTTLPFETAGLLLVFARIGSFVLLLPGIGDDGVPPRIRLMFALWLSLIAYPVVALHLPSGLGQNDAALLGLLVTEILVGLALGALVRMLFAALGVAGNVIAAQTGLAAATLFDPGQGQQSAVIGRFLMLAGVVAIFAAGLHHLLLGGIVRSYMLLEPGDALANGDFATLAVDAVAAMFALGVQLSAPFLLMGLLFNIGLGLVARVSPAIQVFFLAQPLNILLGFGLLAVTTGLMLGIFVARFGDLVAAMVG